MLDFNRYTISVYTNFLYISFVVCICVHIICTSHMNTDCKSMVQLSLACKQLSSDVNKIASSLLESASIRFEGRYTTVFDELNDLTKPYVSGKSKTWWYKKGLERMNGMGVTQYTYDGNGNMQIVKKVYRYTDDTKTDVELQDR